MSDHLIILFQNNINKNIIIFLHYLNLKTLNNFIQGSYKLYSLLNCMTHAFAHHNKALKRFSHSTLSFSNKITDLNKNGQAQHLFLALTDDFDTTWRLYLACCYSFNTSIAPTKTTAIRPSSVSNKRVHYGQIIPVHFQQSPDL